MLTGCGIAHVSATVPEFEVRGRVEVPRSLFDGPTKITIVEANYYGRTETFVALLNDMRVYSPSDYVWKEIALEEEGAFHLEFPGSDRYVGAMWPIPIDQDATHGRVLFIQLEGGQQIYRVTVEGADVELDETNVALARSAMPPILAQKPGRDWDEERWKLQLDFYDALEWNASSAVRVLDISRTEVRDALSIEIRP